VKLKIEQNQDLVKKVGSEFAFLDANKKMILVTGHRRENFGQGF
jgi:UDP-N-acetylglucosamine 2-epimerase (non-hydrolysing)